MTKEQQCCGNCGWYEAFSQEPSEEVESGSCNWPIPAGSKKPLSLTTDWVWDDTTDCSCWTKKKEKTDDR